MSINLAELIYQYFVKAGKDKKEKIASFPGVFRFSPDRLLKDIAEIRASGLSRVLLFGIADKKNSLGSQAYAEKNIVTQAVKKIKSEFPDLEVITDVCLCAYTSHGHCGILKDGSRGIDHKKTLQALEKTALTHAAAGADWVAPSAMAKEQVAAIRAALDKNGFKRVKILGYSAKFASNFYGPFRQAADSAPKFGDRRAYQLDFNDTQAALKEIKADISEGADVVMVKPALGYLDVIKEARQRFKFPLAAFNVSGEYSFVKYGARKGLWDEQKMTLEIIAAIKRSGADWIISYHSKDIAGWKNA